MAFHGQWRSIATMLVAMPLSPQALAGPGASSVGIDIKGTVIATASCAFATADPVKVEFGDVYINEIVGDTYRQAIPYQVTCKGDPDGKTLQMQVAGTGASFDANKLRTDASGLAIGLQKDTSPLALNQWFNFDNANPPLLYAVLEKQSGARFQDGQEFSAAATLKVAYN